MQATEAENKSNKILGDEECINFRPSPNFKHMRKYLKSKSEEANSTPSKGAEKSSSLSVDEKEKVNNMAALVQPPLPPNPPPPDSPLNITLKKEIEDEDYQSNNAEETSDLNHSDELITDYKTDEVDNMNKPKKTMCRQFVRGTCTRGASCIYAHELILSQLPSVYTFCKNFQNTVCTFPKCKFVHATVFEKESFYRTGFLPPHTLAHLKDANAMHPPPPPPLPEGTQIEVPPVFSNPPPPFIHTGSVTPLPVLSCISNTNLESRINNDVFGGTVPTSTSPLKREWNDIDDFSSSPRALDSGEPLAKKCKDCDVNEFRLQCSKNKVEKMMASSEEMNKKITQVTKKNNKLYTVFISLFKSMNSKATNSTHGLNASLNIRGDMETDIMDQLNNFLTSNNRLSLMGDDGTKNILGNNLNFLTMLAELLLSTGERISPNAS